MKTFNITFTFLIIFLLPYSSFTQSCTLADNKLNTQAEVDAFPTLYPGCKVILNSLTIDGNDITDLTPLNGITKVQGLFGLNIKNNDNLTTLAGLETLTEVERSIQITDNPELINISALSNISTIGRDLLILNNFKLPNLDGFSSLSSIDDIRIEGNTKLADISGLAALTTITGVLKIDYASLLTDLSALSSVQTVGSSVFITNNAALQSISGLNQITTVPGILDIANNDLLTDISSLSNLVSVGNDLRVHFNAALSSLSGLENLNSIAAGIIIRENAMLTDITQLDKITSVTHLEIDNNDNLTSLSGLHNITTIDNNLEITSNDALSNLQGLNKVSSVGQNLIIESNDVLTSFSGLDALLSVGYFVRIRYNPEITNFSGLDALETIGNNLSITGCSKLSSLSNLTNLNLIDNFISISDCNQLTSLSGLDNIDHTKLGGVSLFSNSLLETCAIQSICDFIDNGGSPTLSGNKTGCNTNVEITNDCASLPVELSYFNVKEEGKNHRLNWRTESESYNDHFSIEHSVDGISFLPIGKINGAGHSVSPIEYSFVNNNPTSRTNYYRLKQIDFDGAYEYSNVVVIDLVSDGFLLYPNPVNTLLYIELENDQKLPYSILDATGKQIAHGKLNQEKTQIPFDDYPSGVYIIRIGNKIKKIVK